jgi:catechol 2,3-dioxygenase
MVAPSPSLTLGPIRLTVSRPAPVADFYEHVVGLRRLPETPDGTVALGADPDPARPALVELIPDAGAPPRAPHSSGLFHLALLVPDRRALAQTLLRAVGGNALTGASDHLVSEALYLSDPQGNGIELYRDRPREEWRRDATTGELAMTTLPLDLDALLAELPDAEREPTAAADTEMPAGTTLGHVHLQVSDLAAAEAFYAGALGFDVTVRGYPGALFVAAGGYHHHIGLNTWSSAGGPPADPAARGLRDFAIRYASGQARDAVAARVADAGYRLREAGADRVATDPFGIAVRLSAPDG